jgi:hypothetical protein
VLVLVLVLAVPAPLRPDGRAVVADLRKLGKRGSYRLGARRLDGGGVRWSGPAARPGRGPRALHSPAFGPPPARVRYGRWLAVLVPGAVVIAVAAEFGLWFVPFVIGVLAGVAARRSGWRLRWALPGVIVMAAAGWAIPLLWQVVRGQPVGATARAIAALAGLPPHAAIGIIVTLLLACLQAVVGLWLGRSVTPRTRGA